jgi:hypothetical protein
MMTGTSACRHGLQPVSFAMQAIASLLQMQAENAGDGIIVFDEEQLLVHRTAASTRRRRAKPNTANKAVATKGRVSGSGTAWKEIRYTSELALSWLSKM